MSTILQYLLIKKTTYEWIFNCVNVCVKIYSKLLKQKENRNTQDLKQFLGMVSWS